MRKIFLDTAYLQALVDTRDSLHQSSVAITDELDIFLSVTSEMVLTELLNALSGRGGYLRDAALDIVDKLHQDSSVEIIPQTSQLFAEALLLYRQRLDKSYSLTDCASMLIMRQQNLSDVLTFDRHFQQEGFNALLRN
ncbi:MAG: type II toxin-antitoxin system VapC family toxin [Microcystis sp. M038S2]|jgi:predicted nucleic acid-binding protein|uniref:type II toxin-antitoxin system VapC family toxin n=1 Tax=unclassified Microcystis TaxID=2643300 RepID=UPI0011921758|nr:MULTISPECIES: PIN domain-containing protein [unclassified Microcystis]NCQ69445.1 type II toxin-antitoxin system VapC family toxin [Microcystis aeruginosa W13-16]NCQ73982.1 type II toxin-antitoxin system VapC family toxin [Microcystis aeruginosa W13-13]NCQ78217.1 type II toxin-antitoxin system VapC family toxin [Microcystis aeruginosa W13-15]NCS11606.1 type II toxin-antitoxin system VapC family toxin [Microcystis aeruginosa G13-09]TRU60644.1 MAG: PIN domain-containing protein [Microcystis ae